MRISMVIMMMLLAGAVHLQPARGEVVLDEKYLSLVARYLYNWHLDETSLIAIDHASEIDFRYKPVRLELDEHDRSQYIDLYIPLLSYHVRLKKSDYDVPELGIRVQNADYRIVRAHKVESMAGDLDSYASVITPKQQMLDYLFSIRNQRHYPDEALLSRMRQAFREKFGSQIPADYRGMRQTVYVAPLSPVANSLWVYWETGRKIIRFSSDSDINTEAFWAIEDLGVELYDLDKNVVVSLAEAPGSNAFVTRDWAARVLYNCVVFGKRLELEPVQPETANE